MVIRRYMNLNHQQKHAVEFYGSPQVIIAGAGTGKTTVMIEKIKYLITKKNHQANQILALTFTNKAANEMKERFSELSIPEGEPFFGTFHSFCLKFLLSTNSLDMIGLTKPFSIVDYQQQKDIIQMLVKTKKMTINGHPKDVLAKISAIKQFPHLEHARLLEEQSTEIQVLFDAYNQYLISISSVDFDDLLLHSFYILTKDDTERSKIQNKYTYIIIDEYQDTNKIQNDLCILLAKKNQQICVVGDFDQTIYSWRGAKVENLLGFNQHFPTAETQKLEINYRSTKEILNAANQLIRHNSHRLPKNLITDRSSGKLIEHIVCYNEREEAEFIAKKIQEIQKKQQFSCNDFAILYRTNQQSRAIEETLNYHNLPHHIVGATPFYQRLEIKDVIAFLQCLNNINQPIWFERALLHPARGVGKTSIQQLLSFCIDTNQSISEAIISKECPIKDRYLQMINKFCELILSVKEKNIPLEEKVTQLLTEVSFDDYLKKLGNYEERNKNVKELLSKCQSIKSLDDFLNEIVLFQDVNNDKSTGRIQCLTLHSAKGLEFPIVFIPGFEDDLLPLKNTNSTEEERRLAYVGITRGKKQVYLLSAYKRSLMGADWYHNVSSFSKELIGTVDFKLTEQTQICGNAMEFKLSKMGIKATLIKQKEKPMIVNADRGVFKIFEPGEIVSHPNLGTGIIESKTGDGESLMYSVKFSTGKKTLMAKFAPLSHAVE